jgi:hypothetical protein
MLMYQNLFCGLAGAALASARGLEKEIASARGPDPDPDTLTVEYDFNDNSFEWSRNFDKHVYKKIVLTTKGHMASTSKRLFCPSRTSLSNDVPITQMSASLVGLGTWYEHWSYKFEHIPFGLERRFTYSTSQPFRVGAETTPSGYIRCLHWEMGGSRKQTPDFLSREDFRRDNPDQASGRRNAQPFPRDEGWNARVVDRMVSMLHQRKRIFKELDTIYLKPK